MGEWARVLRRGGTLEIRTLDLRAVARRLITGRDSATEAARWLYGDQDHPSNYHMVILDEAALRELLASHGIVGIKRQCRHIHPNNMRLKGRKAG